MTKLVTKVTRATSKQFSDGNWSYSFQTAGTGDTWLRGGKNQFKGIMVEGNQVEIETNTTRNRDGKETTYLESAVLVGAATPAVNKDASVPSSELAAWGGLTTQSKIEYQAARNSAIEFLKLVVGSGAAKIPEAQAAKQLALEKYLDRYTAQMYQDTQRAGAVERTLAAASAKTVKAKDKIEEESEEDQDE
jgi:hypothetical protein